MSDITTKHNRQKKQCNKKGIKDLVIVFHISEDGSYLELKHCMSSKASVKKYFLLLNWIKVITNPP